MREFSWALFMTAALAGTSMLSAQSPRSTADQPMLASGDSVRISVWRKPEYSGDFVVGADSMILSPAYHTVRVAGVPLATAESNVRRYLNGLFSDSLPFTVEPLLRVSVWGWVPRPMVFATPPETSIAQAIARAGGTTPDGDPRKIRVVRTERNGMQRVFRVDLANPADLLALTPVRSGDQIVVDRRKSFFKETFLPGIGVVGSIASLGLLIERWTRR